MARVIVFLLTAEEEKVGVVPKDTDVVVVGEIMLTEEPGPAWYEDWAKEKEVLLNGGRAMAAAGNYDKLRMNLRAC